MIYLIAALLLSLLLSLRGILPLPAFVSFLNPIFFHLLVVGWVTQMIFGVIYWMFPIITRKNPRGSLWMGWATYICLNTGLLLRVVGEPLVGIGPRYQARMAARAYRTAVDWLDRAVDHGDGFLDRASFLETAAARQ